MSLIPVGVTRIHHAAPYNSADKPIFVAGSDSQDYAAKLPLPDNPCLPAAEAIGYYLCGRAGIAVPATAVLTFEDGRMAFGSRIEAGVSQFTQIVPEERLNALRICAPQISQLCLLDAFMANPDRHSDNLLFRPSPFDGRWTVIGMDFSRALWRSGFPDTNPNAIFATGNTATLVRLMKALGGFNDKIALNVVASLQAISGEQISTFLDQLPVTLRCAEAEALIEWWNTPARLKRIESLMELFS